MKRVYALNRDMRRVAKELASVCAILSAQAQAKKEPRAVYERLARLAYRFTKLSELKLGALK